MGKYKNKNLSKTERVKTNQEALEKELKIQEALKKSKKAKKVPFQEFIKELYQDGTSGLSNTITFSSMYYFHFNALSKKKFVRKRKHFRDLVLFLYKNKCFRLLQETGYLLIVFNIAVWFDYSKNDYKSWKRKSHNADRQLLSLIRHCFERYEVPKFLYHVWEKSNDTHINWFIELTNGKPVKELNMPVQLTKKGAHYFRTAPDGYNVNMAIRWAQSLSYGTDKVIADYLANSFLSRNSFEKEQFWEKVMQFVAKQTMLDPQKLGEVLDYLDDRIDEDETYTIKGRTINSLIRASDAWHVHINRVSNSFRDLVWKASCIAPLTIIEGKEEKEVMYKLYELRSTKELSVEGKKMNHCVATYARSCHQGNTSIFTLRKRGVFDLEQILATIEVNIPHKMIVQAKARFNKPISNKANEILKKWAVSEGLGMSKWL